MPGYPLIPSPGHSANHLQHKVKHPPATLIGRSGGVRPCAALGLLVSALLLGGVSCAAGPSPEENPMSDAGAAAIARDAPSMYVITEEDIRAVGVGNLYEVVQRLRPLWLRAGPRRSRRVGQEIMVIQNGMYFGDVESLRELTPSNVLRIRYMDSAAATAAFSYPGVQPHISGAIVVEYSRDPRK